jgi:glycerol-3-phosphate O-acyltransferase
VTPAPLPSDGRLRVLAIDARFPARYTPILLDFFEGYQAALVEAGIDPAAFDHLLCGFIDRLEEQLASPFTFEPYHQQITEPFDYYRYGVEFLRPLVDTSSSSLRGHDHLDRAAAQLAAGENVVFFANHQTEGDPQAISLLLEDRYPRIGQEIIFVAGERVTTDPLAVPFSIGRNLLCIYSKRYIDNPPDLRTTKQLHNRKTMERMSELFDEGGKCVYVAPSGGRDRANARGVVEVAAFDPQSIEMFYLMARRAGRPAHFYPMALATYDFLPPPETIQVEIGERRRIKRTGIHMTVGAAVNMEQFPGSEVEDKHARREARARHIWQCVSNDYARMIRPASAQAESPPASGNE